MSPPLSDIALNKVLPLRKRDVSLITPLRNLSSPASPAKPSTVKKLTVPIPTRCTVRVVEGSCLLTVVQGNATEDLSPGDTIRIGHPHKSRDYTISSDLSEKQIFLTEVFHGSSFADHQLGHQNEKHCMNYQVFPCPQTRLWKLVSKDEDKRLEWRIRYDDGDIPWKINTDDSVSAVQKNFGVPVEWDKIEVLCRDEDRVHYNNLDDAIHQQRLHYFEKVPLQDIIIATYNSVCEWHPIGKSIDNVKWAKLARKMKFLSSLKNSNHQVDMAFFHRSCDRKLNINQFTSVLQDMANLLYPPPGYSATEALANMLWTTLAILPEVNKMIWSKATKMAVSAEIIRTCAQIRISAYHRSLWQRRLYVRMRQASTCISKNTRRWSAARKCRWILRLVEYDCMYRIRYVSAVMCQKIWRGFTCVQDFTKFQQLLREEERVKRSGVWQILREKGKIKKASLVFRKVVNIQSVLTITSMILKERRRMDKKNLEIQVYVPKAQRTFHFRLREDEIRECIEKILVMKGPLSWNEMLGQEGLSQLTKRLMARIIGGRPLILFCRRDIAEKGELIAKRLVKIEGVLYIAQIYRSPFEIVVKIYYASTCKYLRAWIALPRLIEWLSEDQYEKSKSSLRTMKKAHFICTKVSNGIKSTGFAKDERFDSSNVEGFRNGSTVKLPILIDKKKQPELINWLLKRLRVVCDPESHNMSILLEYECEAEKREKVTRKIQSKWRITRAKNEAKRMAHLRYEKWFNKELGTFVYVDVKSGIIHLTKPTSLGNEDIENPPDEWRITYSNNSNTGETKKYYRNPLTGQTSWLSEENAALIMQRKFREVQTADLIGSKLDFSQAVKTMTLINDVEVKFKISPNKLPNIVNYALLCHCIRLDFNKAKPFYKEAFARSSCHPIIARSYAIFILASCEAPQVQTFRKACELFKQSDAADPRQDLFRSAKENFFNWAARIYPDNVTALLNYALLHQCVMKEYYRAEKIYRRALALNPDDSRVASNFNFFEDQRYPGGYYADSGVPFTVVERSHIVEESLEWGEWKRMKDPVSRKENFSYFWFNSVDKSSSFEEPDWKLNWKVRANRSKRISDSDRSIWVKYHDEKLNRDFVFNQSTGKFKWDQESK